MFLYLVAYCTGWRSPSSRRAWIEIRKVLCRPYLRRVALLAEGVDRNFLYRYINCLYWVALLAEGVDRNLDRSAYQV